MVVANTDSEKGDDRSYAYMLRWICPGSREKGHSICSFLGDMITQMEAARTMYIMYMQIDNMIDQSDFCTALAQPVYSRRHWPPRHLRSAALCRLQRSP